MDRIDITMTAVLRPNVVRGTLKSFCKRVFIERDRYRLIVNIDSIGEEGVEPLDIVNVCRSFFSKVKYNISDKPCFSRAVIWTWRHATAPWIMHLEDDWTIHRSIDINHMINILNDHKELACLRLYKEKIPNKKSPIIFGSRYDYNDEGFFIARDQKKQFGLNPVLVRGEFVREAVPLMVDHLNPEKQFRYGNKVMRKFIMEWKYALYGKPGDPMLVYGKRGLKWRRDQQLAKPKGEQFMTWEKRKIKGRYMK